MSNTSVLPPAHCYAPTRSINADANANRSFDNQAALVSTGSALAFSCDATSMRANGTMRMSQQRALRRQLARTATDTLHCSCA